MKTLLLGVILIGHFASAKGCNDVLLNKIIPEAVKEVLRFGHNESPLHFTQARAAVFKENERSIRLLNGLGFEYAFHDDRMLYYVRDLQ